jgi:hypothetical protein
MGASPSVRLWAIFGAVGIGGLLWLPGVATAGTLLQIYFTPAGSFTPTYFNNTPSASLDGASGAIQISPGPVLLADSTATESASANLSYDIDITGPGGVTAVPIDITYVEEVVGTIGYNFSTASIHIGQTGFGTPHFISQISSTSGVVNGDTQDYSVSATYSSITAGDPNYGLGSNIILSLATFAAGPDGSAFIDPIVSIDPSYFTSSGYSPSQFTITLSGGVGNSLGDSTPAPEPPSGWLLLTAIGAVGGLRFRKRGAA